VKGLKARGGFEVNMQWENGELTRASVKSSLGGNCRIRSFSQLKGKGLKKAQGQNSNSFYNIPETKAPLIHSENKLSPLSLKEIYEYDIPTRKGFILELTRQ
jgi:alpha-L-fucosidase 2